MCGRPRRSPSAVDGTAHPKNQLLFATIPTSWYVEFLSHGLKVLIIDRSTTGAKRDLLEAALNVIRTKGYSATTVDDICKAAAVTKGAFFHHFASKEAMAVAAAEYWSTMTGALFAAAPYHTPTDPVERLLGYVAFRKNILQGQPPDYTCLVGTMVQETFDSAPAIREACNRSISGHAAVLETDIVEAMRLHGTQADFTAKSLALYTQAVIQGAFVLAKAKHSRAVALDCLDHLYRYIESLFPAAPINKRSA